MLPKINFSKVKTISVEGQSVNVWYLSGHYRRFTDVDLDALKAAADKAGKVIHGLEPDIPWCDWCGERPAAPGEPCEVCRSLGADPEHIEEQTGRAPAPIAPPEVLKAATGDYDYGTPSDALTRILGLSPDQATRLQGADRLNFWRNSSLSVQIQHGSRSTKLACPKAIVTDAQLVEFFACWGWKRINGNLYFQATPASLVRL